MIYYEMPEWNDRIRDHLRDVYFEAPPGWSGSASLHTGLEHVYREVLHMVEDRPRLEWVMEGRPVEWTVYSAWVDAHRPGTVQEFAEWAAEGMPGDFREWIKNRNEEIE